ncbi:MAG: site-specific integrase [Verrucomicrobiota bacterium]
MATLVKDSNNRSPYWIACYTAADGRRLKKSTKQRKRTKALEVALALERAEAAARAGTLTETRARQLVGEVLERTTGESLIITSTEGWLRDWLRGKKVSKSVATYEKYTSTVEAFIAHLGPKAKLTLAAVAPRDLANFRDALIAAGRHPHTVRDFLRVLSIPFNAARRQGLITTNPVEAVESPARLKSDDTGAKAVFTPEQVAKLMETALATQDEKPDGIPVYKAGKDWRGVILTAYLTGARLQDVCNLTWNNVDLPGKTLTFVTRKTRHKTVVPLHPELEVHLLSLDAPDSGQVFLFPDLAGKETGGKFGLSMTFSRIMARAKITGEVLHERKGTKGRTVRSLSFHSLRHSFNSAMANAGISQELRMKLTGHIDTATNAAYTHLELEPLRRAVESIPGVGKVETDG